jgi:GNAT superfamily N-acetyltransferase
MKRWQAQLTITAQFIAAHETFMTDEEGETAGFYALVETPESWRLEHLWVLPNAMGRGLGRGLFTHAATRAKERGAPCLTIEADPNAEPFYMHMGAVRTGVIKSEIDGHTRELPLLRFDLTGTRRKG